MNKRTVLIAVASALGGAALVAATLLVVPTLGDDRSESDPQVEQLELAADSAKLSQDIEELTRSVVDGEAAGRRPENVRDEATELIGIATTLDGDAGVGRALRRANEYNLDSTTELESVQEQIEDGRTAVGEEQEASEEASDRLAGLSSGVAGLNDSIDTAEKRAMGGLTDLEKGLAAISAELDDSDALSTDAQGQLVYVKRNLRVLHADMSDAFEALRSAADGLSGDLAERSEELEPDVVLDCPELTAHGAGIGGVSVRNISCAEAAALLGQFGPPAGFACTQIDSGYEFSEYRCTSGDRAIRYGVGA